MTIQEQYSNLNLEKTATVIASSYEEIDAAAIQCADHIELEVLEDEAEAIAPVSADCGRNA